MAKVRERLDSRRAEHDAKRAQRRAEDAEDYAAYAVAFAYSAGGRGGVRGRASDAG